MLPVLVFAVALLHCKVCGYHMRSPLIATGLKNAAPATLSVAVLLPFLSPLPSALADDRHAQGQAKMTAKVSMDVNVGVKSNNQRVQLGLYGEEAPTSTKFFLNMCQGDVSRGLSYEGAQVSKVVKDSQIEVGKFASGSDKKLETYTSSTGVTRTRTIDKADMAKFDDKNDLRHDSAGVVSMKKGGGFFGFTIAPAPNVNLDEENVVIGRVIEGMNVISMINEVPTSKEDSLGMKRGKKACLSLTLFTYIYTYSYQYSYSCHSYHHHLYQGFPVLVRGSIQGPR